MDGNGSGVFPSRVSAEAAVVVATAGLDMLAAAHPASDRASHGKCLNSGDRSQPSDGVHLAWFSFDLCGLCLQRHELGSHRELAARMCKDTPRLGMRIISKHLGFVPTPADFSQFSVSVCVHFNSQSVQ